MFEIPALLRAAIEVELEEAGIEIPRVSKNGQITELDIDAYPEERRIPVDFPLLVSQRVFLASYLVQNLTGERPRVAQELLELVGGERAEVLEDRYRDIFRDHEFTPKDMRDCLSRARRMIGANGRNTQPQFEDSLE